MPTLIAPLLSSAFGFSSATALAIAQIGTSLLLSAASKALMGKPDLGSRTLTVRQPVTPRDMVYGGIHKGGTLVYVAERGASGGAGNSDLDLVIAIASHRVKEIKGVYLDGELAFPAGSSAAVGRFAGAAICERFNGDANQLASAWLQLLYPGVWTANHRLRGIAYIHLALHANSDVWPNGIPNVTVDVDGCDEVYDPRSGTTGYTSNAALCLAHYLSHARFGLGAQVGADDGIDTARLIEAANICDEYVVTVGGGTEPRYTCNGSLTLDQTPKTIIESLLTASAGTLAWSAGVWHVYPGAYRPPSLHFTQEDVAGQGLTVQTRVAMSENFNGVRGQFFAPENDWQPDDFPAYQSAVYLAEDGGEARWADIALPFTSSASMAQRLAKIHLERQRRQFTVSMQGKLSTWRATVGDVCTLSYDRWGFAAKPFEVRSASLSASGDEGGATLAPEFVLRETSPLIYDWTASEGKIYAAAPRTNLPSAFNVAAPTGLQVTEDLYQTAPGVGVRAMAILTWQASTGSVDQYQAEMRLGTGPWQLLGRTDQTRIEYLDIQPGQWEFRVKAISRLGVSSAWAAPVAREIFGLGAPPAAMSGVTLQVAGGLAILKWAQHADLDVRIGGSIVIRHSASASPAWGNSVSMDVVAGAQAIAVVPQKPGSYLIRAVDASGIAGPVTILNASGAQVIDFAPVLSLTENPGFTGTKTGCFATGTALQLSAGGLIDAWPSIDAVANIDAEGGILPTGTYQFASGMDFGSVRRMRLRSEIQRVTISTSDLIDSRVGNIDDWLTFDGPEGGEVDVVVEVRLTSDDPSGSPTWGAWGRVDSAEIQARALQARAILTSTDATFAPSVTQLRLVADEVTASGGGVEAP